MSKTMRLSSARLAILFVAIFACGVSLLLTAVYFLTARVLDREVDAVIRGEVDSLVDDYMRGGLIQLVSTLHRRSDNWGRTGAVYLLTEGNGYPIAGNLARWPREIAAYDTWIEFNIDASDSGGVTKHPVRAHTFRLPGGRRLLVGTDILERRRLASRLRTAMFWGVGSSVALAALVGAFYSRRVRRRVTVIADTCRRIMNGNLAERLPIEASHDEFDELATAVNQMLHRIHQQTDMLRTTFDSAAHDLRAPLYRARVRIEEALQHEDLSTPARETMEATLAELERVQRTLGTLLQIAQTDGRGSEVVTEDLDLAALAREMVELYQPEAGTREIALEYSGADTASMRGNRQLLAQAIVNLVENALKYVHAGGRVAVDVQTAPRETLLSVADNGPGIPVEDRERIMQPFVRLERDRGQLGSGLGLSLVAAVMRLHQGSIELADNEPGLKVVCRFLSPHHFITSSLHIYLDPHPARIAARAVLAAQHTALRRAGRLFDAAQLHPFTEACGNLRRQCLAIDRAVVKLLGALLDIEHDTLAVDARRHQESAAQVAVFGDRRAPWPTSAAGSDHRDDRHARAGRDEGRGSFQHAHARNPAAQSRALRLCAAHRYAGTRARRFVGADAAALGANRAGSRDTFALRVLCAILSHGDQ
jgi:signal transduction histidine kinase